MPEFQYVALDDRGREVRGRVEGADQRAAAAALRARSLFLVRLEGAMGNGRPALNAPAGEALDLIRKGLNDIRPVTRRDRIIFFQQMALMLRTGLTLLQALEVAREQATKGRFARTIDRLTSAIQAGESLSQAMRADARQFTPFAIKLIETAEASGELDRVLDKIAEHLERRAELQRKLLTGLTYPAIVVVASVGVAAFLVVKIIPKFSSFFSRRQVALPWSTQMLVSVSDFFVAYGPIILGGCIGSVLAILIAYSLPPGRRVLDRFILRLPVFGSLVTTATMAQFSSTMGMLLASGVTLLESLKITGSVLGNRALSEVVSNSADQILRGQDLTRSLRNRVVPPLVTQVVAVGERTGSLSQVLDELSDYYDKQLQARIHRLSAMIEPVMTIVIGGMVGFVYFSFFQAVFALSGG